VQKLLDVVLPHIGLTRLALHFHDTYGMAVANSLIAWSEFGIAAFDGSAGGLGGCPYAPGASGNVATEDLVYALKASGALVDVAEQQLVDAAQQISGYVNHPLTSRLSRVRRDC
jgi:hydroxymethylglutaryl-CoA lyase